MYLNCNLDHEVLKIHHSSQSFFTLTISDMLLYHDDMNKSYMYILMSKNMLCNFVKYKIVSRMMERSPILNPMA